MHAGGGGIRGRALPGQPDGAGRAPRREPARRHLARPRRPGARRARRPGLRGARRREGGRRRLPVPPHAHRRGRRRTPGRRHGGRIRGASSTNRRRDRPRDREPLGATGPPVGADRRRRHDHRPVVAGRPQRRRPGGCSCSATSSSAPSSSASSGPFVVVTRARVSVTQRAGRRHRRPAAGGAASSPARGCACGPSTARARGVRRAGRRRGAVPTASHHAAAGPARRPRRGDARHRLGRAVRVAVVDPPGAAPPAVGAPRLTPLRPGAAVPGRARTRRRPGEVVERPRADWGLPRGRPPVRARVTAGGWSTGGSTAHAGTLMVRELERPSAEPVTVTVDLPADPDAAERVAEARPRHRWWTSSQGARRSCSARSRAVGPGRRRGRRPASAGRRLARAVAPARAPGRRARRTVSVFEAVRRANRPGLPEDSVRLRARLPGRGAGGDRAPAPRSARSPGRRPSAPWCSSRPARRSPTPPGPGPPGWVKVAGGRRRHRRLRVVLPLGQLARRATSRPWSTP